MEFYVYKIANIGDKSSKTVTFFREIENAAKKSAQEAGVSVLFDVKTPDDEDLPASMTPELKQKAPCVLLRTPNGQYWIRKSVGTEAQWQQMFLEAFRELERETGKTMDIYIIYSDAYQNQSNMREKVKKFVTKGVPHTIKEYKFGSMEASRLLDGKNTPHNVVIRFGKVGKVYQIIMNGDEGWMDRILFPSDFHFKDVFEKATNAYKRWLAGEKVEDIAKKDAQKEKETRDKAEKDPFGLNTVSDSIKKGFYYLGAGVCAYQALKAPTEMGQVVFGAAAAGLFFKANE